MDAGGLTKDEMEKDPRQSAPRNLMFDAGERVQQQNFGALYDQKLSDLTEISATIYFNRRKFSNKLPMLEPIPPVPPKISTFLFKKFGIILFF